jgi:TniQ/Bacterial regulatory helix-turn-helix protein, lysR family
MLAAVGLQQNLLRRDHADWLVTLTEPELDTVTSATGVHPAGLQSMTLSRFTGALDIDYTTRHVRRSSPAGWRAASRSRFCPRCLAATEGRWRLAWRLGWYFACLDHRCLLAETCPRCGKPQRRQVHPGDLMPEPGTCANAAQHTAGRATARCRGDLTTAAVHSFPRGHPALRAQETINALLTDDAACFGVYANDARPAGAVLDDITALTGLALAYPHTIELQKHLPVDLLTAYIEHGPCPAIRRNPNVIRRRMPLPGSSLTAAVAAVIALQILEQNDVVAAGDAMRWLITRPGSHRLTVSPRTTIGVSARTTNTLETMQIKAFAPMLSACDQLRYKCASNSPRRPVHDADRSERLVRAVPSALWPTWSLRVAPPGANYYLMPAVLACAALLGGTGMSVSDAVGHLGSATRAQTVTWLLNQTSGHASWPCISTALLRLSAYLDRHPVPIDYARRRALDYSGLMPDTEWRRVCRDTHTQQGAAAKAHAARSYLFEMISGRPARQFPNYGPAQRDTVARYRAAGNFALALTPELAARLHAAAQHFLSCHCIDEPLTWHPPLRLLDGLALPGDDPALVDLGALHRLANRPHMTIGSIARQLDTTIDVVRHLLIQHPAALHRTQGQRPRRSKTSAAMRAALSAATLTELYHDQGLSISAIARQFGTTSGTVTRIAAEQEISLRRFDIGDAPIVLLPALAGQCGWQRLHRFASAVDYPNLVAAAAAIGVAGSNVSAQIQRLERDLGAPLINRATSTHAMTPTTFGDAIARAVRSWGRAHR